MKHRLAAFDFDGTLTATDSVIPFLRKFVTPAAARRAVTQLGQVGVGVVRRDRDRLRAAATMAVFKGVDAAAVKRVGEEFAAHIIEHHLRPEMIDRLQQHLANDDQVVLVSASYSSYLMPFARSFGIRAVLSSELETQHHGAAAVCTGHLRGANVRGPEKVRRLRGWMDANQLDRDTTQIWAYGDSAGDRELLAFADHQHWVGQHQNDSNSRV